MSIRSINFKNFFVSIGLFLAKRKFLFLIFLGLIALGYLGAIIYFFVLQSPAQIQPTAKNVSLNKQLYERVISSLSARKAEFDAEATKTYPDPFN